MLIQQLHTTTVMSNSQRTIYNCQYQEKKKKQNQKPVNLALIMYFTFILARMEAIYCSCNALM